MIFNSLQFLLFFLAVYLLYLVFRRDYERQNCVLLAASLVFYGFWDWRFLSLIIICAGFNYFLGIKIDEASVEKKRKAFLVLSAALNLGMLGIFKYNGFFTESFRGLFNILGLHFDTGTANIILPLGISFYIFQAMSYPIDIYRKTMKPAKDILNFLLFVSFFPLVAAGPIERARNMLPQIESARRLDRSKFYEGSWLFFWGLFKKIFVADNLARVTFNVFSAPADFPAGIVTIASYAFVFQVYADFSGYSDMARGAARILGFNVMANFRVPFFSKNVYDLWQRWHISLTTWIKEYLYYPLALARFFGRQLNPRLVILITWAIMGFWHGPEWRFVVWGLYHGVILVIYSRIRPFLSLVRIKKGFLSKAALSLQMLFVFHIFGLGLLLFAVNGLGDMRIVLGQILKSGADMAPYMPYAAGLVLMFVCPLLAIEYFQFRKDDEFVLFKWPVFLRGAVYYILLYLIITYGVFNAQRYYYFQF